MQYTVTIITRIVTDVRDLYSIISFEALLICIEENQGHYCVYAFLIYDRLGF